MEKISMALLFVLSIASIGLGQDEYYPLKKGHAWTYQRGKEKFAVKVVGTEKVGDTECFVTETRLEGEKEASKECIAVTKDGVKRYKAGEDKIDPPVLFLKLPLKKGERWEDKRKESTTVYEIGGEEDVEVPAGKFKAFKVTMELTMGTIKVNSTHWYASGVGIVKETFGGDSVNELVSFEKGKD